jgi:hypothetical protein
MRLKRYFLVSRSKREEVKNCVKFRGHLDRLVKSCQRSIGRLHTEEDS